MNAPIETDWITDADPAHPGVYQRKYPDGVPYPVLFHKWDGRKWLIGHESPELADAETCSSVHHGLPWRGVVPEVLGCIPVEADAANTCRGCHFLDGRKFRGCASACMAVNCSEESIIWRPRSEVAA